jgi:hypothetical protein
MFLAALVGGVVTVLLTMPHPPPPQPLNLTELNLVIPNAAQTEVLAAMVRSRMARPAASPGAPAAPGGPVCAASSTPYPWDSVQRENATLIVEVGIALEIPERGQVVALATAMQESLLRNLGHLGDRNDHDSLGLFQQRPSMGWGTADQVTDPVYAATAFYLALKRVPAWDTMAITVAAQRVQRSAFPNAYARWETDATSLVKDAHCSAVL